MSRSGYSDSCEGWDLIRWRGAVASAIRGKRGQAFLKELLAALDSIPDKTLIAKELEEKGSVCALGAVGKQRGVDMSTVDPEEHEDVAAFFDIPHTLACEIMYENDECVRSWQGETPQQRWQRMRKWVVNHLSRDGASHEQTR